MSSDDGINWENIMKEADVLLEKALREMKYVGNEDEFRLRDLFSKVLWKSVPAPVKVKLGTIFYNTIMDDYPNVLTLRNPGDKIPHRYKLSEKKKK